MTESIPATQKAKISTSPLGKNSLYISEYLPTLLHPIARKEKRDQIGIPTQLPFKGVDIWNAYEVSWLNLKGKPMVAIAQFDISCCSKNIVESKSFKLYLNSFNNTKFNSLQEVKEKFMQDLSAAIEGKININLLGDIDDLDGSVLNKFSGISLDNYDITCDTYFVNSSYLFTDSNDEIIEESLYSNLFKSNCLVTGQPDWGSIKVDYKGKKVNHEGLLRYLISFRNHNEFHEQCVERIFMDIMQRCNPETLTVEARYTRRGGLDINPIRSTHEIKPTKNIRMPRQ